MSTLLIQNGRIIDPANGVDQIGDLFIVNDLLANRADFHGEIERVIDATGLIVSPGLIDPHVCFREPGFEEDETIRSGAFAALAGGFTAVACLPDTVPAVDTRAAAEFVIRQAKRARSCRVLPMGSVTKGHLGQELAEMGQLSDGGAVGFSDGKRPIANAEVMRRALQYTSIWNKPILHHAQVPELAHAAVMHEGFQATLLGLPGMPAAAEEIMVRRDIALAETTGGRVHWMSISSFRSVEEIKKAKDRGLLVTADVTPHHLLLTDKALSNYDTNYKVDPPFRTEEHRQALLAGLVDGTIDIISSDHQPLSAEKKSLEFDHAPFGISSLDTFLPLCVEALITPGLLDWPGLLRKLTINPALLLGVKAGRLDVGRPADITLIDPHEIWTIDTQKFHSRSTNTPFANRPAQSRVKYTIVSGEVRYDWKIHSK